MSLPACADLVRRGDPDRFLATMAAPPDARRILFPIYAFNVEVARAPWLTDEPLIAEMRLQWWRDVLDEIAGGGPVRRHEVATPLAAVLDPAAATILCANVEARRRDAQRIRMDSVADLRAYLRDTGGALLWAATRALDPGRDWGPPLPAPGAAADAAPLRARGFAVGEASALANYLLAVPALLARGVNPLPDMTEAAFAGVLDDALAQFGPARPGMDRRLLVAQRVAELSAWRARGILRRARRNPALVATGGLAESEFRRRAALLMRALRR